MSNQNFKISKYEYQIFTEYSQNWTRRKLPVFLRIFVLLGFFFLYFGTTAAMRRASQGLQGPCKCSQMLQPSKWAKYFLVRARLWLVNQYLHSPKLCKEDIHQSASYDSDAYDKFCSTVLFRMVKNENRISRPKNQNF